MADNVIRNDIVKLDFEVEGLKELKKLQDETNELKKKLTGGIGDDALDGLKKGANDSVKPLKNVKEQAEKVKKSVTDIGKKAATTAFKGLKKLAGISFKALTAGIGTAATALGFLMKNAVSAYSEYEQLYGGMQTLLGAKGAKSVEEYAKLTGKSVNAVQGEYQKMLDSENYVMTKANDAFKTAGMSANEYMETITSFAAAMVTSVGGDTKKAAELSDMAIQDMADNANKMGTPLENVSIVYSNLARGMYMTLDNLKLGYAGTKEGATQMVNDAAKIDKSVKANDISYANLVKAIHAVQVKMDIYGTTSKEAFGTIQGSMNTFKAAWGNLMPALIQGGDAFDQCVNNLVDSIVGFKDEATGEIKGGLINNLMPAAEKALEGIGTLIDRFVPILAEQFPKIAKRLIPPLIKAAVELVKGLVKALPDLVKIIGSTFYDIFSEQFPAVAKIGKFFQDNSEKIAKGIKIIIPTVLGLAAAFKGFKAVKSLKSLFGNLKGGKGGASGNGGILSTFQNLAKMKTKTVLKGVANLAIILGALGGLLYIATKVFQSGVDFKEMLKVIVLVGILGAVGIALAKFIDIAGKIKITTALKGVANIAIIVAGLGALLWAATKVFQGGIDFKEMIKVIALIGILGVVGTVLAVFAGIVGLIPVSKVALGLANIAIIVVGLGALLFVATKVFKNGVDFGEMLQVISLIGILGVVGGVLAYFAGIVGLIPFPLVIAGLANIATVIGGLELILVALGALSKIPGFKSLIESGGELLATTFKAIGKAIGSLVGGFAEGVTSSLPQIGEHFAGFAKALEGVDFTPIKEFFNALSSISGLPSSGGIFQMFTGDPYNGLMKMIPILPLLAASAKAFMVIVGDTKDFSPISSLLSALSNVSAMPSSGGFFQLFTGDPYAGLCKMVQMLPSLGEAAAAFFASVGSITDFSPISSLLNALSSVKEMPSSGGFFQFFTGDPYAGLCKMVSLLPLLGAATGIFFKLVGGVTDFSPISSLLNALASVKELPKSGGFAQFFTGDPYAGLCKMMLLLPPLGAAVSAFFKLVDGITDFSVISSLFNTLSSVKDLPKAGGFAQFFTGDPYKALTSMVFILPSLGQSVKAFFKAIDGIDDFSKISALFAELGQLDKLVGKDGGLFNAIGDFFNGSEDSAVVMLGASLKRFASDTKDFFALVNSANLNKLNGMWLAFANVKGLDSAVSQIVTKISELPKKMGDALKQGGSSLSDALVKVWKDAVQASVAPVNKVLDAANWILKEFGSNKRVITWKPYAKGTNGHKGGNALVNDGNGAELVQMPNGEAFIPTGKNVLIPNAPKGMKVLPAEQTAQLMGKKSPTFAYADGIGDIDIWSYIDNAKGLTSKIADSISYDGLSGFRLGVSQGMVTTFTGAMTNWVDKLFKEEGVLGLANYVASKGVAQWKSTVIRALKMEGLYSAANVERTLFQMQTESGGNPKAINLWDSNAKKGIPSKGLMQVIDPTFKAYARAGFDKNIYDPLSNILAAIRYAVARYGSLARAFRGVGYANGGFANKPSIFGEDGLEAAIPLSRNKRSRGLNLWAQTGEMLGVSYSPEGDAGYSNYIENNTYSPQFTLNISGTSDDRTMARKVKNWVKEAWEDVLDTYESKTPQTQEV